MGSETARESFPAHHRAAANATERNAFLRFAVSSSRQEGRRLGARAADALWDHGRDDRGRPA